MTLHFLFLYIFIVLLQFPVIWERYKTLISVELNLPFKLHNMEFYRELLKMVKPSQQKKMSGLDYFSTEGGEAFDEIIGMVDKLSNVLNNHEEIKNDLNMIKKFYKFDYASKISKNNPCIHYCSTYALSDPANPLLCKVCDHQHNLSCPYNTKLIEITTSLHEALQLLPESQENKVMLHDFNNSKGQILSWRNHILRGEHQNEAYSLGIENVSDTHFLIVKVRKIQNLKLNSQLLLSQPWSL